MALQSIGMSHDEVIADRLGVLRTMSPAQVAQMLGLLPHAAALLVGVGELHQALSPTARGLSVVGSSGGAVARPPDLKRIALAVGHTMSIRTTLEMLEPAALQLTTVLASFGGSLDAAEFARELEPVDPARRDELVESLVVRLLAERRGPTLALRPGVGDFLRPPGRPLDRLLLDQHITSDSIAKTLRRLDAAFVPSRKSQRISELRAIIGSVDSLALLASKMPSNTRQMFDALVDAGPRGAAPGDIGVPYWQVRTYSPVPANHPVAALRQLNDMGLIWIDETIQRIGLWLEVHAAVRGRLFVEWPAPAPVHLAALHGHTVQLPPVLMVLQNLLRLAALEPLPGLKTRGIGVRTTKDLAKRLGVGVARTTLLVDLAQGLGLIEEVSKWVRSGRTGSWQYSYRTQAAAAFEWNRVDAIGQWASLVAAWIEGRGATHDAAPSPTHRRQAVADLIALPPGVGITAHAFADWFCQHHVGARHDAAGTLHDELAALDLIPTTGTAGLTALARELITDPASAAALLPDVVSTFVVQADLTIVAPPALASELRSRLDRLCTVESDSSVVVFRLDPTRIATELADGESAESMIEFLTGSSSAPVASSVGQMIRDVERRRAGLTIAAAATVVTADDVLGLAEAVKVKAARLTLLAPTVAVSELPLPKVLAALRAKGLAPTGSASPNGDADEEIVHNPWRAVPRPSAVTLIHPSMEHITEIVANAT